MKRRLALVLLLAAAPEPCLNDRVAAQFASLSGARIGLVVADADGREIIALLPDQRFVPASTAKIVTTAAAFATLPAIDRPDVGGGAAVRLEGADVVLEGHGDARLSSAADCVTDCLATLADAVAARTRTVRDVMGDDSVWPDERWSTGMGWNNLQTRSGTAASALALDDDEVVLTVAPGAAGRPPAVTDSGWYRVENAATTGSGPPLAADRQPGSDRVRLTGAVSPGAAPIRLRLGIDDPARYAAWTLRRLLAARGIRVTGTVRVRHRPAGPGDDPASRGGTPPARSPALPVLARLVPPPLLADIALTNKLSQNLHAQLLLHRLGAAAGTGSVADGLAAERAMLARAGVDPVGIALYDGSGMSTYDRASPRAMATLLGWIARQPWGPAWRATLPVGGEGTLARRFAGTALAGRIWAKTGTLAGADALAGYLRAGSGRLLTFAAYANDVPPGAPAAAAIDRALLAIAAAQ